MPSLATAEAAALASQIDAAWELGDARLKRSVKTRDFGESMALAVRIGFLAEAEGHHPDLTVAWGRLEIELWTHAAEGLTRNDFVLAAKIDELVG